MSFKETRVTLHAHPGTLPPAEACLVIIRAKDRRLLGRKFPLVTEDVSIGREPGNTIVLDEDDVSRLHARITANGDRHSLSDLRSTNGTYLNEIAVEDQALSTGDHIRVGSTIFKYLSGGDVEALYHEEIRHIALLDDLTGIYNQRYLVEFLEREIARCRRHGRPLSLIFFDIDYFKRVNDAHGHLAGDEVLRRIAALVKPFVRREECFARYGGEEFALVLPDTPLDKAMVLAQKTRARIERAELRFEEKLISVTISAGVVEMDAETNSPADFIGRADARLYEAKRNGRNRVES
jgi:two-component system cell cycle response regulator